MSTQLSNEKSFNSTHEPSASELMLIKEECIFETTIQKITKKLNEKSFHKMSRYSQNKMRDDFQRATEKLNKIKFIKAKYLLDKSKVINTLSVNS